MPGSDPRPCHRGCDTDHGPLLGAATAHRSVSAHPPGATRPGAARHAGRSSPDHHDVWAPATVPPHRNAPPASTATDTGHSPSGPPRNTPTASTVVEPADQTPDRHLVMKDLVHRCLIPIGLQHRNRDRILRHVHPEMREPTMRHTGHGRLLSVCGSVHHIVDDPRTCGLRSRPFHHEYACSFAVGRFGVQFMQIIEISTDRIDDLTRLEDEWRIAGRGRRTGIGDWLCVDRSIPERYFSVNLFASYDGQSRTVRSLRRMRSLRKQCSLAPRRFTTAMLSKTSGRMSWPRSLIPS